VHAVPSGSADARLCYTLLDLAKHTATEIVEEGRPVAPQTEAAIHKAYSELLHAPWVKAVVISGSKAPGFSPSLFPSMVAEAKAAGKIVVCDYRGQDLLTSVDACPDVIKPNFTEFVATFLGKEVRESSKVEDVPPPAAIEEEVRARMEALWRDKRVRCVLTRGS
jgi:fructose-1-phosphate kinase PfkB-like protein